jgi:hypothetical protein
MYEKDLKERFIDDYMRSRIVAKTSVYGLFRKIEQFERELKKDACYFTKDEILQMYESFKSRSAISLLNNNVILKAYCEWNRYYNKLAIENPYNSITFDDVKLCVDKNASRIMSADEIIEIEDSLLNYTDAAIIHALFSGINGPSMIDLTGLDVTMLDKQNKCLLFPDGRVFDIDNRLVGLLEKAFNEETYATYGSTMRVKRLISKGKLFKERDNCIGSLDTDDKRFRACYRKIQVIREYLGIEELTMKGISAAGFLHYLKQGLKESGLELREFLLTDKGCDLMDRYGYTSKYRVGNVIQTYKMYI